jgi:hypothetical protein
VKDRGEHQRAADDQNLCRPEEARNLPIYLGHPYCAQREPMPEDV